MHTNTVRTIHTLIYAFVEKMLTYSKECSTVKSKLYRIMTLTTMTVRCPVTVYVLTQTQWFIIYHHTIHYITHIKRIENILSSLKEFSSWRGLNQPWIAFFSKDYNRILVESTSCMCSALGNGLRPRREQPDSLDSGTSISMLPEE